MRRNSKITLLYIASLHSQVVMYLFGLKEVQQIMQKVVLEARLLRVKSLTTSNLLFLTH